MLLSTENICKGLWLMEFRLDSDELPVGVLLLELCSVFLEDSQIIDVTETLIPDILTYLRWYLSIDEMLLSPPSFHSDLMSDVKEATLCPLNRPGKSDPQGNEKMVVVSGWTGIQVCGCRLSLLPAPIHCGASFNPQGSAVKQASSP